MRLSIPHRGLKFMTVGVMGTAVKVGALVLLDAGGLACLAATALAVELSLVHNFAWHLRWTWRDRSRGLSPGEVAARLLRFHLATGSVTLAANLVTVPLLVRAGLHIAVAGVLATMAAGLVNFLVAGLIVFTHPRAAPSEDLDSGHACTRL